MNMQQTCDPDRLDAFVRGELSEQQESELTAHLDQCAACGEELERRVAAADQWREASELLTHRTRRSNIVDLANDPSASGGFTTSTTFAEQMDLVVGMLAPTDDPEMLGRIGSYEVSGVIGCGGMGVVFKAHDRSLDRVVAIKVMAPHLAGSGAARKRFARESKAAAAVLHPNVIAIHCVADDPKLPYLVMPYIGGASLQKRVEADGPLCTQDTLRIGQQIAAGLAAAHAQGLVHRDIKPANILLERGVERVTITDFGLARAVDDATMTRSGVIAGTPQYMSPEQARGESVDHRSDLFSLGSVLYMMCAGHSPFRAETTFGILRRITDNQPRPLRESHPDVPEWLCAIIEKLHAKEPSERFQSAEEVAELLEGCLAHVQQPATTPLPVGVQALAAQAQLRAGEIPMPNRLKAKHQRIPPFAKYIAAAAGAFALFFAGILIVLETNKGTLTIQCDANDVPIRVKQGDKVVEQLTVSQTGKSIRIAAGNYVVEVDQAFDAAVVIGGNVTLKRGDTETVKVALVDVEKRFTLDGFDGLSGFNAKGDGTAEIAAEIEHSDSFEFHRNGAIGSLKITKSIALKEAAAAFNRMAQTNPIGRNQPALTVDEIVGAFRAWMGEKECNEKTRKAFQQVIDSQSLLPGQSLLFNTKHVSDGFVFDVWSIQFGDVDSYAWFTIRNANIASRPKSEAEQQAWQQLKKEMGKGFDNRGNSQYDNSEFKRLLGEVNQPASSEKVSDTLDDSIIKVTQANANTPEEEKAKDEAAKAWLRRPIVGSTNDATNSQTNVEVRPVFAYIDGEVHEVLIGDNSVVTKGQLLLRIRNSELQVELSKTSDQINEANLELDRLVKKLQDNKDLPVEEVEKAERECSELQKRVLTLSAQMNRLNERCELLVVKSTVAGKVITKNVELLLKNRFVVAGQVLLEIAIEPSRNITEKTANHPDEDGAVVTIPLKAEWVPEDWLKRNIGRRHLTIVADGVIKDEAKPNVVNRVQRGILHDCRLESFEKRYRDGIEYWNTRLFVPRKPMYSIGALWFKDAIDTYRIGDRHTPVPSPDLTQDNPQVKLDEAMKEGHVFRLDYVNDDFENNLPVMKPEPSQTVQLDENAKDLPLRLKGEWKLDATSFDAKPAKQLTEQVIDALVTFEFNGVVGNATLSTSGIGWVVDQRGHILVPSETAPRSEDYSIEVRYADGSRTSARRVFIFGHLALLKPEKAPAIVPIRLNSQRLVQDGDQVLAILNGTDVQKGTVTSAKKTIVSLNSWPILYSPPLRFPNAIETDFKSDAATLFGAPLLTPSGEVVGMLLNYAPPLFAIPLSEIQITCREFESSRGKAERVSQSDLDNNASDTPPMPTGMLNKEVDSQPEFPLIAWDFEYPLLGRRMAKLRVSKDLDLESVFPGRQTVKGKAPEAEVKELIELIAKTASVDDGLQYQNTVSRIAEFDQLDTSVRTERVAVNRAGRILELQLNKSLQLDIENRLWRLEGIVAIGGQDALTDLIAIANQQLQTQFPEIKYKLTPRDFLFGIMEDSGTRIVKIRIPVNKSESTNTTEMNFTLTVPTSGEPKFEQVAVTNSADDPPMETPALPKTLDKSTREVDSPKIYTAKELIANGMELYKNQQIVTVRFKVASVRRSGVIDPDGKETQLWFLSSEEYKGGSDPEAFEVEVSMDAEKSLERSGVKEIPAHFNGQELIIVGKVSIGGLELLGRDAWVFGITLERLDQLHFVKANGNSSLPQKAISESAAGLADNIATESKAPALDHRNARSVVEAYVASALAGDVATAASLAKNSPADPKRNRELPEFLSVQRLKIDTVYINDPAKPTLALATSVAVKLDEEHKNPDGRRDGFLVFTLEFTDEKWFVIDIDFETESEAEKELNKFRKANPHSIGIPPQS